MLSRILKKLGGNLGLNSWTLIAAALAIALFAVLYVSQCGSNPSYDGAHVKKLEDQIDSANTVIRELEKDRLKNAEQITDLKRQRDEATRKRKRIVGEDLSNKTAVELASEFDRLFEEHPE